MKLIFLIHIYIIVFLESVTGLVDIKLNPLQVVQDVNSTQSMSFSCQVNAATEIQDITSLQLRRNGQPLARIFAVKNVSAYFEKNFEQEATSRGFVLDWKYVPTTPPTAFITLSLNRSKVMCSDQLQYSCHLDYFNMALQAQSEEQYSNLSVYVPPIMVQNALKVYKDGIIIGGGGTRETALTNFNVGDAVTLECGTTIGSDSNAKIYWKITSEVSDNTFVDHPSAGNISDELTKPGQCEFTRIAKTIYNITSVDANRNYKTMLGFLCYVVAFHEAARYETPTSEKFYINLGQSAAVGGKTEAVAAAGASVNVGAVVGGVIGGLVVIIIIAIVVWIVLFRRNEGSTYATKEEYGADHPNRAPTIAVASSDYDAKRSKNEYTNDAYDEPRETKPRSHRHDNDRGQSRGRHNPAMERGSDDDDKDRHSRDGSPTWTHDAIGHMDGTKAIGTGV